MPGHEAATAKDMGWEEAADGDLLRVGEAEFDAVLIVLLARRNILQTMAPLMPQVLALLLEVQPGKVYLVSAAEDDPE